MTPAPATEQQTSTVTRQLIEDFLTVRGWTNAHPGKYYAWRDPIDPSAGLYGWNEALFKQFERDDVTADIAARNAEAAQA